MPSVILQGVLSRLRQVRRSGEGYVALCPSHDDQKHSLSIGDGDRGIVLNCHAGCTPEDVARAMDLELKNLFFEGATSHSVVAEYEYRDENNALVYVVERREPKDFRQRRPDGAGGWTWNLKGVKPLPYRLPELLAADLNEPVIIVEGEKDVDALRTRGFCATCNSGGAGKWKVELSRYLDGRHVVIIPDNDDAGRKHATLVEESLAGHAASVRILELAGLKPKGDVSDWLAGHSTEDLRAQLPAAEIDRGFDKFIFVGDCTEPPEQQWVWDNLIPKGFVTTLYAMGGSSKSFLAQYISICIALNEPVFGLRVQGGPVLFLDGELDRDSWLRRAFMLTRAMRLPRLPSNIVYRRVSTSLLDPKTRKEVHAFVRAEQPALVVIDSFTACLPGADTNSIDDVVTRMKAIDDLGTVLLIDHTRKTSDLTDTTPIGSVAKWNFARSAIQLTASKSGGTILKQTKSNFGPLCDAIPYTLEIGGGLVFVKQIAIDDERLDGVEGALPVRDRIVHAFKSGELNGGATATDIADMLEVPIKTVRNKLTQLQKKGVLYRDNKVWRVSAGAGWTTTHDSQ